MLLVVTSLLGGGEFSSLLPAEVGLDGSALGSSFFWVFSFLVLPFLGGTAFLLPFRFDRRGTIVNMASLTEEKGERV